MMEVPLTLLAAEFIYWLFRDLTYREEDSPNQSLTAASAASRPRELDEAA